jgi:hypothetical protein
MFSDTTGHNEDNTSETDSRDKCSSAEEAIQRLRARSWHDNGAEQLLYLLPKSNIAFVLCINAGQDEDLINTYILDSCFYVGCWWEEGNWREEGRVADALGELIGIMIA